MKIKKELLIILVIQITEVLGFSLVLPFLPFFAEDLGASPFVVGLILSAFSLFQFISAPIMGRLSDHYGRRPLLILSQFSTFLGFIILGLANSIPLIFLSRIVDGLLGSNFTIAQAYLSDISTKKDRSRVFGFSGVAFGLGFLVGPAIGGFLSRFDYSLPSFLAAGVSLITILTTIVFLPETVKNKSQAEFKLKIAEVISLPTFKKYFSRSKTALRLGQFFTYNLAHVIWVSSFALYAKRQLNIKPEQVGYILAYVGLLSIILRGILLGKLINWLGEARLKITGVILVILGLTGAIFSHQAGFFLVVLTFFAIGSGLARPLLTGAISRSVPAQQQGAILGLTSSLGSLAQILGPFIGGITINCFFAGCLGLVASLVMTGGLVLTWLEKTKNKRSLAGIRLV